MAKINKIISDYKRIGLNKYIHILGNVFISLIFMIFIQCTTKTGKEAVNQSFSGEYKGLIYVQSNKIEPVKGDCQKIADHVIIKN